MNTLERFWPAAMLLAFFFAAATITLTVPDDAAQPAPPGRTQDHIQAEGDDYEISANTDRTIFYVRTPDGHTFFRDGARVYRADTVLNHLL